MQTSRQSQRLPASAPPVRQQRSLFAPRPFGPPRTPVEPASPEALAGAPGAGFNFADIPVRVDRSPGFVPRPAGLAARPHHTGLPEHLKAGIESLSGYDLSTVRVHYHSAQPAQLQALAYTQGADIHIAPGQEQHLPHEAWHVVQQAQGRVKPTLQLKGGVPVNDDKGLEQEADRMGRKVAQTQRRQHEQADPFVARSTIQYTRNAGVTALSTLSRTSGPVIQRMTYDWNGQDWVPRLNEPTSTTAYSPTQPGTFKGQTFNDITGKYSEDPSRRGGSNLTTPTKSSTSANTLRIQPEKARLNSNNNQIASKAIQGGRGKVLKAQIPGSRIMKLEFVGSGGGLEWRRAEGKTKPATETKGRNGAVYSLRSDSAGNSVYTIEGTSSRASFFKGVFDEGDNTIAQNVRLALDLIDAEAKVAKTKDQELVVMIKGHSRGAVAATRVAKWARRMPGVVVDAVFFDPVPGFEAHHIGGEDLNINLDEDWSGYGYESSTLVYSLYSRRGTTLMPLQKVVGVERLILSLKSHSVGIRPGYIYDQKNYKNTNLNSLPKGVLLSQADPGTNIPETLRLVAYPEAIAAVDAQRSIVGFDDDRLNTIADVIRTMYPRSAIRNYILTGNMTEVHKV